MFWRFAFDEALRRRPQVLLVNRADVVPSVCEACGAALVPGPCGESILVAGPCALDNRIHTYCAECGDRIWIPTLAGRAFRRYAIDWAVPLRAPSRTVSEEAPVAPTV